MCTANDDEIEKSIDDDGGKKKTFMIRRRTVQRRATRGRANEYRPIDLFPLTY